MVLRFSILAVAFLLSCTSIERDSVCDEKSVKYNGCVGGVLPSSSGTVSSSSSWSIVYGDSVTYQGETYKTVVIGTQTWMARNLNYAAPGSKCGGRDFKLKDENTEICNTYGRLYNWATAMALPADCNNNSCASQVSKKHRGICPAGWHISSDEDWSVLMKFINSRCSDNSNCGGAGTELKATIGWQSSSVVPFGSDTYGFSALPGGKGDPEGGSNVGDHGYWWTASETGSDFAYHWIILSYDEGVVVQSGAKDFLYSVRCLQD
ncbi:MAG: hypothetical protein LBC75_11550 [Fibromonadaceae bacterium]|jgi:uncharacterized protein (TIGR02145 family)|nr:hypothetical protein [Fibromonadaceae bacterium]